MAGLSRLWCFMTTEQKKTFIHFGCERQKKWSYIEAAKRTGKNLETWVFDSLDAAAKNALERPEATKK